MSRRRKSNHLKPAQRDARQRALTARYDSRYRQGLAGVDAGLGTGGVWMPVDFSPGFAGFLATLAARLPLDEDQAHQAGPDKQEPPDAPTSEGSTTTNLRHEDSSGRSPQFAP